MNKLKKIILPMQGGSKKELHWLYDTKDNDDLKIYTYKKFSFWFSIPNKRFPERLFLYIKFNCEKMDIKSHEDVLPYEDFILRVIYENLKFKYNEIKNLEKENRGFFAAQEPNDNVIHRNGIKFDKNENNFTVKLNFHVPLVNIGFVDAKTMLALLKEVLDCVERTICDIDKRYLDEHIRTYNNQQTIRKYMRDNKIIAFIANDSILPKKEVSLNEIKVSQKIKFKSPKSLELTIELPDGSKKTGMAIKSGITVITGEIYSGKTTLLDAIENGIYDKCLGCGTEFVLTEKSAIKTNSEDGRRVSNVDVSLFFKEKNHKYKSFITERASGSISQAVNIIEAIYGRSQLLLIDEDKSATNFLVRDKYMRLLFSNEVIYPFTDIITQLCEQTGISVILVIGSLSEFLPYADSVILMENFLPRDITREVSLLRISKNSINSSLLLNDVSRKVKVCGDISLKIFNEKVKIKDKKIVWGNFNADVSHMTSISSNYQFNTLALLFATTLFNNEILSLDLFDIANYLSLQNLEDLPNINCYFAEMFFEQIRPIDIICFINRMNNINFIEEDVV